MRKTTRVAVIAGTPVDTQMGVDFLNKKAAECGESAGCPELMPLYCPVSGDCDEQIRFQYSDDEGKRARIDEIFDPEIAMGTRDFFIYCNSLSGAFDFDSYAEEKDVRIYTPLQIYRQLGRQFSRVGVIAANNISAHGIEKALMSDNDALYVIGSGNMAVVRAIENGIPPAEIVEKCGLRNLALYMEACGAEAVLLGCTHFPYFKDEFRMCCMVPVIDPADMMYEALAQTAAQFAE
jgi:hypothetical protein